MDTSPGSSGLHQCVLLSSQIAAALELYQKLPVSLKSLAPGPLKTPKQETHTDQAVLSPTPAVCEEMQWRPKPAALATTKSSGSEELDSEGISISLRTECIGKERKGKEKKGWYAMDPSGKERMRWTQELHHRFEEVVVQVGGLARAKPKNIHTLMNVPGMTMDHVKSHLQKYRLMHKSAKEADKEAEAAQALASLACFGGEPEALSQKRKASGSSSGAPGSKTTHLEAQQLYNNAQHADSGTGDQENNSHADNGAIRNKRIKVEIEADKAYADVEEPAGIAYAEPMSSHETSATGASGNGASPLKSLDRETLVESLKRNMAMQVKLEEMMQKQLECHQQLQEALEAHGENIARLFMVYGQATAK